MSKHLEESDPFKNHSMTKHVAGDTTIFLADPTLIRPSVEGSTPFVLDDRSYPFANLKSRLSVYNSRTDEGQSWLYRGSASYEQDERTTADAYFAQLQEIGELTEAFTLEHAYYHSVRLMVSPVIGAQALIHFKGNGVDYVNQELLPSANHSRVSLRLNARHHGEGGVGPETDLLTHIKGHVFATNALARAITGCDAILNIGITPEGPQYFPDLDERSRILMQAQSSKALVHLPEAIVPESEQIEERREPRLDSIGGLEDVKRELKKVVLSFTHAEVMEKWGAARPQAILLYGPAGTGKTTLAHALSNEIDGELWELKASDIVDQYVGNSEKKIEEIFNQARAKSGPTVMLLDEFEALMATGNAAVTNAIIGVFKREMNRLRETSPNVVVVATTNHKEKIDPAVIRAGRFDIHSYVALPETEARVQILANVIAESYTRLESNGVVAYDDSIDAKDLADKTEGFSGADIVEIIRRASFQKAVEEVETGTVSPISQGELVRIIQDINRHRA